MIIKVPGYKEFMDFRKELGEEKMHILEETARMTAQNVMEALKTSPKIKHEEIIASALSGSAIATLWLEKYGEEKDETLESGRKI
jgi:hypothetical protein